jgi:hypothetical protein
LERMRLPAALLRASLLTNWTSTPLSVFKEGSELLLPLPEMMLPAAAVFPPMVLLAAPVSMDTPLRRLPSSSPLLGMPSGSVTVP